MPRIRGCEAIGSSLRCNVRRPSVRSRGCAGTFCGYVTWVFQLGLGLYGLNLLVGMAARFAGARFGVWHHVLYAAVFASAIAAAVLAFHPGLLLTLAALAAIPWLSARSAWHPALAGVGFAGYLIAAAL